MSCHIAQPKPKATSNFFMLAKFKSNSQVNSQNNQKKIAVRAQINKIEYFQPKAHSDFAEKKLVVRDVGAFLFTLSKLKFNGFLEFQAALASQISKITGRNYTQYQIRSALSFFVKNDFLTTTRRQRFDLKLAKKYYLTKKLNDLAHNQPKFEIIKCSEERCDIGIRSAKRTTNKQQSESDLTKLSRSKFNSKQNRARDVYTKDENSTTRPGPAKAVLPHRKKIPGKLKNNIDANLKKICWWIEKSKFSGDQKNAKILAGLLLQNHRDENITYWTNRFAGATNSEKSFHIKNLIFELTKKIKIPEKSIKKSKIIDDVVIFDKSLIDLENMGNMDFYSIMDELDKKLG